MNDTPFVQATMGLLICIIIKQIVLVMKSQLFATSKIKHARACHCCNNFDMVVSNYHGIRYGVNKRALLQCGLLAVRCYRYFFQKKCISAELLGKLLYP